MYYLIMIFITNIVYYYYNLKINPPEHSQKKYLSIIIRYHFIIYYIIVIFISNIVYYYSIKKPTHLNIVKNNIIQLSYKIILLCII